MKFKIPSSLKSRKLWLSLIAAFVAFGNSYWGWGFKEDQVLMIIGPLLAYVGVEGIGDIAARFRSGK